MWRTSCSSFDAQKKQYRLSYLMCIIHTLKPNKLKNFTSREKETHTQCRFTSTKDEGKNGTTTSLPGFEGGGLEHFQGWVLGIHTHKFPLFTPFPSLISYSTFLFFPLLRRVISLSHFSYMNVCTNCEFSSTGIFFLVTTQLPNFRLKAE